LGGVKRFCNALCKNKRIREEGKREKSNHAAPRDDDSFGTKKGGV